MNRIPRNTVLLNTHCLMSFGLESRNSDIRTPLLRGESEIQTEKFSDGYQKHGGPQKDHDEGQNRFCDAFSAAWKLILDFVRGMFCRVAALLAVIFPFKQQALTEKQEEKLRVLWYRAQVPFDSNTEEHVTALKQLWAAGFPDTPWEGQRSKQWAQMGWQGMDPATDFRGGGYMALECLLDLHRMDPLLFQKLMNKSEGKRSEWEYPFAVAGVSLTFTMTEMLKLRSSTNAAYTAPVRGFLHLIEVEEEAFAHLFCIMFELLDKKWLEMKASYMEFPLVMKTTRLKMEEALSQKPRSLTELRRLLA